MWLIPFKPQNDFVLVLLPRLICQTKLATFLEVSSKIMHYSCRRLQESFKKCKKCKVLEDSGKGLLICPLFLQEMSVEQIRRRFLARFFQELCQIFLYLQNNFVVVRFLPIFSDASLSCKILARYLWRIIQGNFSFINIMYILEYLIMPC